MGEISLLHGDPLPEKPFLLPSLPQTDPLALGIRINPEKYSQIIGIVKIRMQGIGALYDSKGRRRDGDRSGEGLGSAGKGTVSEGLSGLQRQENLLFEGPHSHRESKDAGAFYALGAGKNRPYAARGIRIFHPECRQVLSFLRCMGRRLPKECFPFG